MKVFVLLGLLGAVLCLPLAGCSREMGPDSDVTASQWENQFLRDFASANGLVSPSGTGGILAQRLQSRAELAYDLLCR